MTAVRVLFAVLLIAAGVGGSLVLASKAAHSLRDSPYAKQPPTTRAERKDSTDRSSRTRSTGTRDERSGARTSPGTPRHHDAEPATNPAQPADEVLGLDVDWLLLIAALEAGAGVLLIAVLLGVLSVRRVRMRRRRRYGLYELHLSPHDEAKAQDLEDMVESIANIVRAWPTDRARNGQPYVAVELIYDTTSTPGASELEWSINVRCQPEAAPALDAAISATYPDVRLGRRHAEHPVPRSGELRTPGHVLRFRKERSFIYPLIAPDEGLASPPLEQIAIAQAALGQASVVRFQLTPTPSFFEEVARKLYKRRENILVRQERWGLPEGGLWSTLNRAEMGNAQRTQNRSLFWLELVVAADTREACKTVAAAVQSRRGENRLHRRWMIVRQDLYRRRFPTGLGPLLPSMRCLVSAAEAAHLLALPSARMKGVPVRRLALPRIPAPPEVRRAGSRRPTGRRRESQHEHGPARRMTNQTTGATR